MRSEEFIKRATAHISDPEIATEARKELRSHLEEAISEMVAQGVEPESAEMMAVSRMGSPESLALELAEAHHKHLPWRIYLAPVPIACLTAMLVIWDAPSDYWRVGRWWIALLLFCLAPTRPTVEKLTKHLVVDMRAKWHWVQRQPLRSVVLLGALSGALSGLVWGAMPIWEPFVRSTIPSISTFVTLLTALTPVLVAVCLRWIHKGAAVLTAVFAALAFPAGYLPGLLRWWHLPNDWVSMAGFFVVLYALAALAIGWMMQKIRPNSSVSRT